MFDYRAGFYVQKTRGLESISLLFKRPNVPFLTLRLPPTGLYLTSAPQAVTPPFVCCSNPTELTQARFAGIGW